VTRRRMSLKQNMVIVGAGDVGQMFAEKIVQLPKGRLNLLGFVDDDPKPLGKGLGDIAILGRIDRLTDLVEDLDVDRVVIAFSRAEHQEITALIRSLAELEVQVDIVPRLFEALGTQAGIHTVEGLPFVSLPSLRLSRSALLVKRTLDIALSTAGLVLLSPVVAIVAAAIKRTSPGPVFYRHKRVGKDGREIGVFKFRTMHRECCRGERYGGASAENAFMALMADPEKREEFERDYKLAEDPRVTKVGAFLRRTSLDELPQLINILKGDLSLVGPRPVTQDELARYGEAVGSLLNVTPGLTGHWQISGRSATGYTERVRLDLAYATSWSLKSDLMILAKTFGKAILARQGAV
jgi:exopolysaccharide biosynthesis polyprenyl glycosylphosphotransferase